MMHSLAAAHMRRGGGALLFALTLAPGISHAGETGPLPVPDAAGGPWLIVLGLVGLAGVALLSLLFLFGDASARRRRRLLRAQLERLDLPAAVSGVNGKPLQLGQVFRPPLIGQVSSINPRPCVG
jgi:hypothetical protein